AMGGNIDADLLHDRDGERIQLSLAHADRIDIDAVAVIRLDHALRHRRAQRVLAADEQHALRGGAHSRMSRTWSTQISVKRRRLVCTSISMREARRRRSTAAPSSWIDRLPMSIASMRD